MFPWDSISSFFIFSTTLMSFVFYTFKDFNVFYFLRLQRLQCLLSFTLSKTSMSSILWFSKTSTSSTLYFNRTQCPLSLSFIGINVLIYIFHRTQMSLSLCLGLNVLFFYAFKNFKCLMLLCYRTPMSSLLCFVGLQGPLFGVTWF